MNRLKYGNTPINEIKDAPMTQEFNETTVNLVANQGAKIGAVWLAIGITSWTDAAAFLAFVLSALALSEYVWKKMLRPALVAMGVCKPVKKRVKMVEVDSE